MLNVSKIENNLLKGVVIPKYTQCSILLRNIVFVRQYGEFLTSTNFGEAVNNDLNSNERVAQPWPTKRHGRILYILIAKIVG